MGGKLFFNEEGKRCNDFVCNFENCFIKAFKKSQYLAH